MNLFTAVVDLKLHAQCDLVVSTQINIDVVTGSDDIDDVAVHEHGRIGGLESVAIHSGFVFG